jgi:hypothetical protein
MAPRCQRRRSRERSATRSAPRDGASTAVAARLRRALGATNGSQCVQPPPDPARPIQIIHAGLRLSVDSVRRRRTLRNSLTRKRSQVQILYGPRHFSKLRLAVRAAMRASHLQFCPSVVGHSALGCGFTGDSLGFGILSGGSVDLPWRSLGRGSITESERLCTCHCADSAPTSGPTDTPRRNARLKVMRDRTSKKAEHLSPRLIRR